jgi:hypothetical protein
MFLNKLFHGSGDILATLMYYSIAAISGLVTSWLLTLSKDPLRAIVIYLNFDLCSALFAISVAMISTTETHPTFAQEFLKSVAENAIITWWRIFRLGCEFVFWRWQGSLTFFLTGDWRQVLEMSDSTKGLVTELEETLGVRASSWQAKGSP